MKLAKKMSPDQILVINLSGRGDKDCAQIEKYRALQKQASFNKESEICCE